MDWKKELQEWYLLGNSGADLLVFVGILLAGILFRRFISNSFAKIIHRFFSKSFLNIDDCIRLLRKPVELLVFWLFLFLASQHLHIPREWNTGVVFLCKKVFEITLILSTTWLIIRFMNLGILVAQEKWQGEAQKSKQQFIPFLNDLFMVFIVTGTGFVLLGRIFEVDVVALITGLGLGGLALALAARETLENLFASFTIFLDLPFVVGDTIQVGQISGDIEKIGFRSTRLRAVDGNLIVVPNRLLTSQSMENLSDRAFRRSKFLITCAQGTSAAQITSCMQGIEQIILANPMCIKKAPKIIFEGFGAYSLDVSIVYHVETQDYHVFQSVRNDINLHILALLEKEGIGLASSVR